MAKCKSVIGKVSPKDGSHVNEKENKALGLNQVYKPKQVPPQPIRSTTPSVSTTNAFEVLNTKATPAHIEDMVHQHDTAPYSLTNKMDMEVRSSAPDLDAAATGTDINTETGKSIRTTSEGDRTSSHHSTVPHQVTSWANAFDGSGDEPEDNDYVNDFVGEDDWLPLQGEGSSKPSNEFDDTPYMGQQSNTMAMVPFESSSALTAA
ncbi:hypothetical protein FNV43_RR10279 [Rhamnella rubrinervis]|uniref:Uncharacterized protein n=1 Tax=Rhamnella rubrinervis TaxID=2594499 RepID=A0A8K0HCV3_9ROSA|nr:hypothetical protein FNV43_RR10279 [Rhamnella rubrinervis]